jgi:hypothetical protein
LPQAQKVRAVNAKILILFIAIIKLKDYKIERLQKL